jgi:anti-sigma28 factor (negative regulator of flagellin synthesis)
MRISDRYERFLERVGTKGKPGAGGKAAPTEGAREADTTALKVSVSDEAKALAAGTARLDELRSAVRNGTYKVDAQAIARRLVGGEDE